MEVNLIFECVLLIFINLNTNLITFKNKRHEKNYTFYGYVNHGHICYCSIPTSI